MSILTVTTWNSTLKHVTCAFCAARFCYQMRRSAVASSQPRFLGPNQQDRQDTRHRAQSKLNQILERQVDPVPCPHCRKLQPDMVWTLRRRALSGVALLAVILLLPAACTASAICLNDPHRPAWWNAFLLAFAAMAALLLLLAACVCAYPFTRSGFDRAQPLDEIPNASPDPTSFALPRPGLGRWLAVRPTALSFPPLCTGCGKPPAGNVLIPLARLTTLAIPVCPACRSKCFRVRTFRTLLPALVVLLTFGLILLPAPLPAEQKIAMTLFLTVILGLPVALLLRNRWIKRGGVPIQVRGFHDWSDDINIRFRAPHMAERFLEECLRGNAHAG